MPSKKVVRFKVFLVDFSDVRAPNEFSSDWVRQVLFSSNPPMVTPDANRDTLDGSIFQYFFAHSDGWLRVMGDTTDWVNSGLDNRDIPHWSGGMTKPEDGGGAVDYGESWPVVVAEALRGSGLVSTAFPDAQALRDAVLALPDGGTADELVFLHTDVAGGGVKRGFAKLKTQLNVMSHANVNNNTVPGSSNPWSSLWDEGWAGLPEFLATPILSAGRTNRSSDGTYPPPAGAETLRMEGFSILLHEFGHLALDLPDFYTDQFKPWGNMCLMGGPASETHSHMPLSSLARHLAGHLDWTERSRSDHRLRLRPFETHNLAYRITNGPPGSSHFLIVENRQDLAYKRFEPPTDRGPGLLAYHWDKYKRVRMRKGSKVIRNQTALVRSSSSSSNSSLLWKAGETIGAQPAAVFDGASTLRNGRGELWFTLDSVAEDGPDLIADLRLRALHLLGDYHRADWVGIDPSRRPRPVVPGRRPGGGFTLPGGGPFRPLPELPVRPFVLPDLSTTEIEPDRFAGPRGHVILQDERMPVAGREGRGLYLHPRWVQDGRIRGTYPLDTGIDGPRILYAKIGMADAAIGSDGVEFLFRSGAVDYRIPVGVGQHKLVVLDFADPGDELVVEVATAGSATRDWAYIADGWLVPDAPRLHDLLSRAGEASWESASGSLTLNGPSGSQGEVSTRVDRALHDGQRYYGRPLFTHPNWAGDGFVRGTWSGLAIPPGGAFIRGALGWAAGRVVRDNGVAVAISWRESGNSNWMTLMDGAKYGLSDESGPANDLMYIELALPNNAKGKTIDVRVQVDTDGSSAQDWVTWTKLAVTSA